MSKFFIHCSIAGLLFVMFEMHVRSITNDYSLKSSYFAIASDTTETLILGSSVAFRGLDPEIIGENSFNYAFQGQSHDVDLAILTSIISETPNLQRVILTVSAHSLKNDISNSIDPFRASHYCLFTDFRLDVPFWHHLATWNFVYYRDIAKQAFSNPSSLAKIEKTGFSPFPADWNESNFTQKELDFKSSNWMKKLTIPESFGAINLSRLIEFCTENVIEVLLLETPISPSMQNHLGVHPMDDTSLLSMNPILKQKHVTYQSVPSGLFTDQDFYDPTHLNENGARKWSSLVREVLLLFDERSDVEYQQLSSST